MSQTVNVHFLPRLVSPQTTAGNPIIVIDVLRATTTIVYAMAAGAQKIVPCLEVQEARQLARQHGPATLLGGERKGLPIDGFDLSNSPGEYTADRVSGRTIVFTTTNGTKAMMACVGASRVLIGAFSNLSAITRSLATEPTVDVICAGTDERVTREDVLMAGALIARIAQTAATPMLNDQAQLAWDAWRGIPSSDNLVKVLRQSQGGRNLARINHESDINIAAEIDTLDVVPFLDLTDWTIRLP